MCVGVVGVCARARVIKRTLQQSDIVRSCQEVKPSTHKIFIDMKSPDFMDIGFKTCGC